MKNVLILMLALVFAAACGEKAGQPETETTGSAQAMSQDNPAASATTTMARSGTNTAMTPDDKDMVVTAGIAGLAEVQMGNLALTRAQSEDVRQFAQRMVSDHSNANAELAQFATTKGIGLATELDDEHKDALEHLQKVDAKDFDKTYMQHMVEDHQKAVDLFTKGSTSAGDTDLKAWMAKTLPTLQEHSQLAKTVAGKV